MLPFLPHCCHFLFSLSPLFASLCFASAPFEVLNNEKEPHSLLSSRGNPSWNSTVHRRGIFLHGHRWKEAETAASKVRPACSDNNSICTEPLSSDLTALRLSTAWLDAKANVHGRLCRFHWWNLTSICSLLGFLWDYKGLIMEPFHVGEKGFILFFSLRGVTVKINALVSLPLACWTTTWWWMLFITEQCKRKWSKTWLWEAISGTAIFCHPSGRVTCVHPLLEVYSGLRLAACFGASLHTFVFSVYVCLVFNNSSMPAQTTRRSPSPSAGSIIRVPSATFNISHPSVLLGDMMSSTEGFVKFYVFVLPHFMEFILLPNLCLLLNVTVFFIVSDSFGFIYGLFGLKMFKASMCGWNLPNCVCIAGDNS